MAIGKQLSDGNPDGSSLGQSNDDLISVYAVTPVARQTAGTLVSSSSVVQVSAGGFGFESSSQGNALITSHNEMRTALINFGILKSA